MLWKMNNDNRYYNIVIKCIGDWNIVDDFICFGMRFLEQEKNKNFVFGSEK